jgi:type I restriction enzyme, R subunit
MIKRAYTPSAGRSRRSTFKSPVRVTCQTQGRLSEVIDVLNERFGMSLNEADKLYFKQIEQTLASNEELREQAHANEIDNFRFGFDQKFEAAVVDRQSANEELFKKLMDDPEFNTAVRELLLKRVYERLADEPAA